MTESVASLPMSVLGVTRNRFWAKSAVLITRVGARSVAVVDERLSHAFCTSLNLCAHVAVGALWLPVAVGDEHPTCATR